MINQSLIVKGVIVVCQIISQGFLLNEYIRSRYSSQQHGQSQLNEYLFYTYPNYFRCRNGLLILDWIVCLALVGSHFKPNIINQNINFIVLGIRTIISIIFLWDIDESYQKQIHANYFNMVIKKTSSLDGQNGYDYTVAAYNSYCVELYIFVIITMCEFSLLKSDKKVKTEDTNKSN